MLEFIIILIGFLLGMFIFGAFVSPYINNILLYFIAIILFPTAGAWVGSKVVEIVKKYNEYE